MIQHVDTALIVGCYLALLGFYVWTFKQIEGVKEMIHAHNDSDRHVKSEDLVFRDVCELQVKGFEEKIKSVKQDVKEVKQDVSEIKSGMDKGFSDIKNILIKKQQ